jgi:hypothetical protein
MKIRIFNKNNKRKEEKIQKNKIIKIPKMK